MNQKGFSLTELLVIVAIIMILSTIFIVSGTAIREKSRLSKAKSFDKELSLKLGYNLIGEWTFDDSNNLGKDTSSYFNNGMVNNVFSALETDCVAGKCLSFTESNDPYIKLEYDDSNLLFQETSELTISAWVKPVDVGSTKAYISGLFNISDDYSIFNGWLLGGNHSNNNIYFQIAKGNAANISWAVYNDFFIEFNSKWVHIAGVYKGGEYVKLFINGKEVNSNLNPVTSILMPENTNFQIGGVEVFDDDIWNGYIDDIRIYRDALSIAQVNNLYEKDLNKYLALTE